MKKSLADRIEQYIKVLISRSDDKSIEIQRIELAETFACVPSQVTYVLSTRFTEKEGYLTESRRGGCGYVRIRQYSSQYTDIVMNSSPLFALIDKLKHNQLLTEREAELLQLITINSCKELPLEQKVKVYEATMSALQQYFKLK